MTSVEGNLMGDARNDNLWVDFDGQVKLRFVDSKITSDYGLLTYCELKQSLGLREMAADVLID